MSCAHTKKFIDAYIDGELEAGAMLEVETHLDECPACKALCNLKQSMKKEIASYGRQVKAPEHLRSKIETLSTSSLRKPWKFVAFGAPVAAAAALLLLFVTGGTPEANSEQVTAVVEDVVQRHSRELPMEVESADPKEAATWFRGKVDFPVHAPGLKLKNASFRGARVSNVQEQQAAQMVYNIDGHRVTLMIFPSHKVTIQGGNLTSKNGKQILTGTRRGYNVVMMQEGEMVYAVSSDLPTHRLISFLADEKI